MKTSDFGTPRPGGEEKHQTPKLQTFLVQELQRCQEQAKQHQLHLHKGHIVGGRGVLGNCVMEVVCSLVILLVQSHIFIIVLFFSPLFIFCLMFYWFLCSCFLSRLFQYYYFTCVRYLIILIFSMLHILFCMFCGFFCCLYFIGVCCSLVLVHSVLLLFVCFHRRHKLVVLCVVDFLSTFNCFQRLHICSSWLLLLLDDCVCMFHLYMSGSSVIIYNNVFLFFVCFMFSIKFITFLRDVFSSLL